MCILSQRFFFETTCGRFIYYNTFGLKPSNIITHKTSMDFDAPCRICWSHGKHQIVKKLWNSVVWNESYDVMKSQKFRFYCILFYNFDQEWELRWLCLCVCQYVCVSVCGVSELSSTPRVYCYNKSIICMFAENTIH